LATRDRELAARPEDLSDLFLTRANAGDVEGIVALYEPDAILALPGGGTASGHQEIRAFYAALLANRQTCNAVSGRGSSYARKGTPGSGSKSSSGVRANPVDS
jgi:hypothetical protein